jgi:hypothetical protein
MAEALVFGGLGAVSGLVYYLTNMDTFYLKTEDGKRGRFDFIKFNNVLAMLHFAIAGAVFFILRNVDTPDYLDFSLSDSKVVEDNPPDDPFKLEVERINSPISILQALLFFYVFTGFTHLYYANVWKSGYIKAIDDHHNPIRWIEYGISASVMIYVVSIVSGVRDISAIIPILGANAGTMYTGYIAEEAIRTGDFHAAKHSIQLGWILQAFIYVTIFTKFARQIGNIRDIEDGSGNPKYRIPPWLYFVLVPTFLYYGSFGVVASMWYSNAKKTFEATGGQLPAFDGTEKWYLYLSLFSKLSLGTFIAYGYSQRGDLSDIQV